MSLRSILDKVFGLSDIRLINEHIFNLPIEGVSHKEEIFNKHLQNLVWTFWFGVLLHKKEEN